MEYYKKEGQIAVLVATWYGSWSTDAARPALAYDKRVVDFWISAQANKDYLRAVIDYGSKERESAIELFASWEYSDVPFEGLKDLELQWVNPGEAFLIAYSDGREWLIKRDEEVWQILY